MPPALPRRRTDRLALGLVFGVIWIVIGILLLASCLGQKPRADAFPNAHDHQAVPAGTPAAHPSHGGTGTAGARPKKPTLEAGSVPFDTVSRHSDGVEVSVRVIAHGVVADRDARRVAGVREGEDFVQLEARVTNTGTGTVKDLDSIWTLTYGPKGTEAVQPRLTTLDKRDKGMTGDLGPGAVRVSRETFVVPCLCQDQAVLELVFDDWGHQPSVFSGALK